MSALRGLGRGIDKLIPDDFDPIFDPTAEEDSKESKLREIPLDEIVPDEDQPRRKFDQAQLDALADSIKEHGVVQPIVVSKEGDKYKIVAGERRWRASKLAGLDKIPAVIRADLNAIEVATAYAKLHDQFNLDNAAIAKRVGKSETAVINTLRLLNLPDEAKHAMLEHKLSEGQMRPLVTLTPAQINAVLPKIIEEGWSARRVEQYKADLANRESAPKTPKSAATAPSTEPYVKNISKKLGVKVKINTTARGSGDIVLKFKDKEEFEKLCSILTA